MGKYCVRSECDAWISCNHPGAMRETRLRVKERPSAEMQLGGKKRTLVLDEICSIMSTKPELPLPLHFLLWKRILFSYYLRIFESGLGYLQPKAF